MYGMFVVLNTVPAVQLQSIGGYICHRHRQCRRQRFSGAFAGAGGKDRPAKPAKENEEFALYITKKDYISHIFSPNQSKFHKKSTK